MLIKNKGRKYLGYKWQNWITRKWKQENRHEKAWAQQTTTFVQ